MDLDRDGRKDIISGGWPGELYLFRRNEDGTFAKRRALCDRAGNNINLGSASVVYAADWDRDGDLDLVVGNIRGEVHFVANHSGGKELSFGAAKAVEAGGRAIRAPGGDSGPCVADWDGDGNPDLLVGADDGSVSVDRHTSQKGLPVLEPPVELVPPGGRQARKGSPTEDCGMRAKVCVTDWNGDGRLDLVMGDFSWIAAQPPDLTAEQRAERDEAQRTLQELNRKLAALPKKLRGEGADAARAEHQALLRRIKELQRTLAKYSAAPGYHGWVWVFLRRAAP
ncbi:MAG: FG-GAP-like repeat-containing protein [Planctomycetota bacterium]